MPEMLVHHFDNLSKVHAVTTLRPAGQGTGVYSGFNLASHVGDLPERVKRNRAFLSRILPSEPLWLNQVHSNKVVRVIRGWSWRSVRADGAVTCERGVVCVVLTADCLPVLLCSDMGAIGVVHAGWKGLADGILEEALAVMEVDPASVHVRLGPCIGPASYQVGEDVRKALTVTSTDQDAFMPDRRKGKYRCDLAMLAKGRLLRAGVAQVLGSGLDTFSMSRILYSARRDGIATGRVATLIWRT